MKLNSVKGRKPYFSLMKQALFLSAVGLAACQTPAAPNEDFDSNLVGMGQSLAEVNCAACHAVGVTGPSAHPDAPPLRTVLSFYNAQALSDDFREHIHVGYDDMPDFEFTVKETEALLAYIKAIQEES